MKYHLKIMALGVPVVLAAGGLVAVAAFAPLWTLVVPLACAAAYCFGKAAEAFLGLQK